MVFKRWTKRFGDSPVTSKKMSVDDSSCPTSDLTTPISNATTPTESDLRSPITEFDSPKRDDTLVCIAFFRRKPGVTAREFYDYWEHVHGPLVRLWIEKYGFVGYTQTGLCFPGNSTNSEK
ncbi:hypothetical protein DL771_000128 [Monosporascus sp. 5C6A]|nr:hypothetical protein DL771_000128 [Monosporascus sp. 5C6A]